MRTVGYIVFQNYKPCTLVNIHGGRDGMALMPGSPIARFRDTRDAIRAITRTQKIAKGLSGSMVDGWEKLRPLFSGHPYVIDRLVHFSAPIKPDHENPTSNNYWL